MRENLWKSWQYNKRNLIVNLYIIKEYLKSEKIQHKRKFSMFLYTSNLA